MKRIDTFHTLLTNHLCNLGHTYVEYQSFGFGAHGPFFSNIKSSISYTRRVVQFMVALNTHTIKTFAVEFIFNKEWAVVVKNWLSAS